MPKWTCKKCSETFDFISHRDDHELTCGKPAQTQQKRVEPFVFTNGYTLFTEDRGDEGIKLDLIISANRDESPAICLPVAKANDFALWIASTMGQTLPRLSGEFLDMLVRFTSVRGGVIKLESGDKRRIREAARLLQHKPLCPRSER